MDMGKGHALNVIYHSVPPRPVTFTFSDMMHRGVSRSKTPLVSSSAPEEYAERFKSRPTTRPAVVDFNGATVKLFKGKSARPQQNGFPPQKIVLGGANKLSRTMLHEPSFAELDNMTAAALHLAPLSTYPSIRKDRLRSMHAQQRRLPPPLQTNATKPANTPELLRFHGLQSSASSSKTRGKSGQSGSSWPLEYVKTELNQKLDLSSGNKFTASKLWVASPSAAVSGEQLGVQEALAHYNDLSELPPPKKILPRRELPWVFRLKVKKGMNALSRIMASKPAAIHMTASGHLV